MKHSIPTFAVSLLGLAGSLTSAWAGLNAPVIRQDANIDQFLSTAGAQVAAANLGSTAPVTRNGVAFPAAGIGANPAGTNWSVVAPAVDQSLGGFASIDPLFFSESFGGNPVSLTVTNLNATKTYVVQILHGEPRSSFSGTFTTNDFLLSSGATLSVPGFTIGNGIANENPPPASDRAIVEVELQGITTFTYRMKSGTGRGPSIAGFQVRELPIFTVTTTVDELDVTSSTGTGVSLREAVRDAAAAPGANIITFAPNLSGQTITLTRGTEIILDSDVIIDASNLPNGITIDGGSGTNRIFSIPAGQTVTLNRLTLTGAGGTGTIQSGFGGAIYNASSLLTLNHCSFQGNSADGGGGIYNSSSSPTFTNCSFQGNSAQYGGGIYNFSSSSPTLTNCSFQGNSATAIDSAGGGILNVVSCLPTLTNCSFQGNSAVIGGGIGNFYSCSPTLNNCIIWNNKDTSGTGTPASSVFNDGSSTPTYSYCLIQGYTKPQLDAGTSPDTNLAPTDPLFVREVDPNLAPTTGGDLRLRSGSPAIDAGSNSLNPTTTDLGGKPRFIDGNMDNIATIDLGAYEWRRVFVNVAVSGGNQDGSSWANAYPHLQSALAATQAGDEIWVATGTYFPDQGTGQTNNSRTSTFTLKPGVAIYGGFPGNGTPVFADRNPATNPTTLSGDIDGNGNLSNNAYHVLTASGAAITASTILDGFTITAGNANGLSPNNIGGGMVLNSASPTFTNCSFQGNSSSAAGGGIYLNSASPTLTNCSFQGNSALEGGGGGIYLYSASPTLTNCSFQGNSALEGGGGGIANAFSSPTLTNCSFLGNSAYNGGGIYNDGYIGGSSPTFNNCSFQGNRAVGEFGAGGGIYDIDVSSSTLNNCSFQGNSATTYGGAIYNFSSSSLTLTNCSFQGNSAYYYGGGIMIWESSSTLTNCSFQGNSALEGGGGGIYLYSASLTLTNCSFQGNSALGGGGIYNYESSPTLNNCSFQGNSVLDGDGGGIYNDFSSSPILNNCIIWKNKDNSGIGTAASSVSNVGSSTPIYSHCLIQGLNPVGTGNLDGTLPSNDPLFVREVDPNLPVQQRTGGDLRLLTGSPAHNAGDDTKNSTLTDLAGNPRKDGTIDLGAYEGNVDATFALLHPSLDPAGDANGNGISNFGDYAAGGNPSAPDDPSLRPKLIGDQLTFSFRNNATDIAKVFQKSTTLLPGSWNPLVLTTDYTVTTTTSSGGRTLQTLTLTSGLLSTNPKLFFRQEFTSTPPP